MIERKRLKNYYLPAVLTVLMALALAPAATLAVTEWTYAASSVKYLDEKGVEQTADDCTSVSDIPDTAYPYLRGAGKGKAKWYVVDSDVSYNDYRLTISGNVHLILTDGHKLRASHGIPMVTVTLRDSVTGEEKRVNGAPRPGYIAEYTLPENPFSAPDGKIFLGWQIGGVFSRLLVVFGKGRYKV